MERMADVDVPFDEEGCAISFDTRESSRTLEKLSSCIIDVDESRLWMGVFIVESTCFKDAIFHIQKRNVH